MPVDPAVQALLDKPLKGLSTLNKTRGGCPVSGHFAAPGTGPEGETCRTCAHLDRSHGHSRTYLKCGRNRHNWTCGPGTDIRARDLACAGWEKKTQDPTPGELT